MMIIIIISLKEKAGKPAQKENLVSLKKLWKAERNKQ